MINALVKVEYDCVTTSASASLSGELSMAHLEHLRQEAQIITALKWIALIFENRFL